MNKLAGFFGVRRETSDGKQVACTSPLAYTRGAYREYPLRGFSVGSRYVHGSFTIGSRKLP
jgi:hypothetical protein